MRSVEAMLKVLVNKIDRVTSERKNIVQYVLTAGKCAEWKIKSMENMENMEK